MNKLPQEVLKAVNAARVHVETLDDPNPYLTRQMAWCDAIIMALDPENKDHAEAFAIVKLWKLEIIRRIGTIDA